MLGSIIDFKKPFEACEVMQLACALTEKWNLAEQSRIKTEELVATVDTRTIELKERNEALEKAFDKLQRTQGMLVQSEKMNSIGELFTGLAYSFNTPVSYISSNLETLKDYIKKLRELKNENAGEDEHEMLLDTIEEVITESIQGGETLRHTLQEITHFTQSDEKERTYVDINTLIERAVSFVRSEYTNKARILLDLGDTPEVLCFGEKLELALIKLLASSIHQFKDFGTISVKTDVIEKSVLIQLHDNGHEMFHEDPNNPDKQKAKQDDLGLYLVRNIIEIDKGVFSVSSQKDQGNTFRIELPIEDEV